MTGPVIPLCPTRRKNRAIQPCHGNGTARQDAKKRGTGLPFPSVISVALSVFEEERTRSTTHGQGSFPMDGLTISGPSTSRSSGSFRSETKVLDILRPHRAPEQMDTAHTLAPMKVFHSVLLWGKLSRPYELPQESGPHSRQSPACCCSDRGHDLPPSPTPDR